MFYMIHANNDKVAVLDTDDMVIDVVSQYQFRDLLLKTDIVIENINKSDYMRFPIVTIGTVTLGMSSFMYKDWFIHNKKYNFILSYRVIAFDTLEILLWINGNTFELKIFGVEGYDRKYCTLNGSAVRVIARPSVTGFGYDLDKGYFSISLGDSKHFRFTQDGSVRIADSFWDIEDKKFGGVLPWKEGINSFKKRLLFR